MEPSAFKPFKAFKPYGPLWVACGIELSFARDNEIGANLQSFVEPRMLPLSSRVAKGPITDRHLLPLFRALWLTSLYK